MPFLQGFELSSRHFTATSPHSNSLAAEVMSKRRTREPKEENVTLGPATRDGEIVFGVAHIFASFNDTFIHVTDLSGRETMVRITVIEKMNQLLGASVAGLVNSYDADVNIDTGEVFYQLQGF